MRRVALHDKALYAEGAVDGAPAVHRDIELDEEIARKERRLDVGELAGMPDGFRALRQKHPKPLILELLLGTEFATGEGVDRVPAHAVRLSLAAVIDAGGHH